MSAAKFALSDARRSHAVRRWLSLTLLGLVIFAVSLFAARATGNRTLVMVGALGSFLFVVGVRGLIRGASALSVGETAVFLGGRGLPLRGIEALEVQGESLVIVRQGGQRVTERLREPAQAAAEIARRAGLRPPRKGGPSRWERRAGEEE